MPSVLLFEMYCVHALCMWSCNLYACTNRYIEVCDGMHICAFLRVCVCMNIHTHILVHTTHTRIHTHTHILTHTQTRTHIFACVHVYTNIGIYASIHIYIYTISLTHTRARAHTHTHTHTHTHAGLPYYYDVASGITQWDKPLDASGKDSQKSTLLSLYLVYWIQSWLLRNFACRTS